jgi:hypothetical protein
MIQAFLRQGEQQNQERERRLGVVAETQLAVDNTPWLRRTGWARTFAGKNIKEIGAMGVMPASDENLGLVASSVQRIFDRCKDGIRQCKEEMGTLLLCWLNSPGPDMDPQPFSVYYEPGTHKKYISYWKRFMCYCLREEDVAAKFTSAQEELVERIRIMVEDPKADQGSLDQLVFNFSINCLMHSTFAPRGSVLVHFAAIMGIDTNRVCFRGPSDYGQILAGLIYCSRLLLFEHALPTQSRGTLADPLAALQAVRRQWLTNGWPSPFFHMQSLLAYSRQASMAGTGKPSVVWSGDGQTLIYRGRDLGMQEFRDFVASLIDSAERILTEELLFGVAQWADLRKLREDMAQKQAGYSFVAEPGNGLEGGLARTLENLRRSPMWESMVDVGQGMLRFRPRAVQIYKEQVQAFLELLLLLMHITGGQPARGTEITTLRYANAVVNML